ncbi:MAG TPA: hypothetical protein VKU80_15205 [Planctomycetota bacterium]|nr:hypothetical protein [Planctomycetota bacterium]
MKRQILVAGLVVFSTLFAFTFARAKQPAGGGPVITVTPPGKPTITTAPFDKAHPPAGANPNEDGYTAFLVPIGGSTTTSNNNTKKSGPQTITVTILTITATPQLNITMYLPAAPGKDATKEAKDIYNTLKAHEDGHAQLDDDVFKLVNKPVIEKYLKQVQSPITVTVPDGSDANAVAAAITAAVNAQVQAQLVAASTEIGQDIQAASNTYDDSTNSGTTGGDGTTPGDPQNQKQAAQQTFKDYKSTFKP